MRNDSVLCEEFERKISLGRFRWSFLPLLAGKVSRMKRNGANFRESAHTVVGSVVNWPAKYPCTGIHRVDWLENDNTRPSFRA